MASAHPTFKGHNIPKRFDHDVILFLDVDAIPLNNLAIDDTIAAAANGRLVGNIQRTNHIQNNQHVFVAPSCLAISTDMFVTIGKPSGLETSRGDVAEEYTYAAEKAGMPIDFYMPMRYDEKPAECESWALKDGMPVYGRGTTFGKEMDCRWNHGHQRCTDVLAPVPVVPSGATGKVLGEV